MAMPTAIRLLSCALLLGLAAALAAATRVYGGTTERGATWRVEAPDAWKPGDALVLYQHGFSFDAAAGTPDLGPLKDLQLAEGYAVAASSYSQRGWAVFDAMEDDRDLLDAVQAQLGMPGEIVPFGGSLGGLLALKLAEDPGFRGKIKGVYALCPAAAGSRLWDQALDLRLAYDVVCSGAGELPRGAAPYPWAYNLDQIPDGLNDLLDQAQLLRTLLPLNQCTGVNLSPSLRNGAMQRRLVELMQVAGTDDEKFFVTNVGYATYALSDLVRAPDKLGGLAGNGNRGVDYGDADLNAAIARVDADPLAALRLRWLSDFRGEVGAAKVLSLHTSRDELVVPANQSVLRQRLPAAQLLSAFVREDTPSHCGFNRAEGVAGWEALRVWRNGGAAPSVADLQSRCAVAMATGEAGPCRFDASVAPPPLDSVIRPRPADAVANPLDLRYSGNWFSPARNGEGIALEMLDGGTAVMYFFTYPPKAMFDLTTQISPPVPLRTQAWMVGVGRVMGDGIAFDDLRYYSPLGAVPVTNSHWGSAWLSFSDCSHGRLRWDGPPDWGSLEVPIERLTNLYGLGCQPGPLVLNAPQASGSWADPAHDGSGFHIEQLDRNHALVMYYGGANGSSSRPGWYTGVAEGDLALGARGVKLQATTGPLFGADYRAAALQPGAVAYLDLQLACRTGSARLSSCAAGCASETLTLQRLTTPSGVPSCTP